MSATILVVDDEPGLTSLYVAWLEERYEVRSATDGASALELVDRGVDAMLLDRQMPGLSGDETLRRLRQRGGGCPVALVTAARPDVETFELPFDGYLRKPVRAEDVFEMVESLLAVGRYDESTRRCLRLGSKLTVADDLAPSHVRETVRDGLERAYVEAANGCDCDVSAEWVELPTAISQTTEDRVLEEPHEI